MKKHWVKIAIAVVAIIILVILVLPLFINANTFRPTLETQLSQALGRQVTLSDLSFSVLSGSLVAKNISIADDPAFSTQPFLQAKSLHIGVRMAPLIFDRKLSVTNFVANSPSINLVHANNGVWNFSSLGRTAASHTGAQQKESAFPNLTVGELKIQNGTATVSTLPPTGRPIVYSNLDLSAHNFSFSKSFPFEISAALPAGGSLEIKGTAGPVSQKDASDTPLNAKISVKHFDPVAAGVIEPDQGIQMVADITADVNSDGQTLTSKGTVHAEHLQLVRNGSPAPHPVDITYAVRHNLDARTGQIESLNLNTGGVSATANGTYQMTDAQTMLAIHVSAPQLPVNQVEDLLPAVGVRLPSGSKLEGGTITANLNATGPVAALMISGPVEIDNTRLTGFDLGSKIGGLKPVSGSQGGTQIQTLRANVTSSPTGTSIQNLYVSVPAMGTATGNGTVTPAGSLNFHILAKLNANSGVAGQALGGLGTGGALGQLVSTAAAKGIPISITGTTADPVIRADLSGLLKNNAGNLLKQQLQQGLGNNNKQSNPAGLLNKLLPH